MPPAFLPRFLTAARLGVVVFCAVVVGVAWVSYRQNALSYRAEADARLIAIAEMKAGEVADWRRERLADGQFFKGNRAVIGLAHRVIASRGDAEATDILLDLLGRLQRSHPYSRVALHGADGVERVSSPADGVPDDGHMAELVREVVAREDPPILALHANAGETPQLVIIAPLQSGLGAILAWIDAVPALTGVVRTWPVPARTAEVLIVRRDGDEVIVLNAVLGLDSAGVIPEVPVARTAMPVLLAVVGNRGTVETLDRQGTPVVAAMVPIEGIGWQLVALQARAELYGPLRERAIITVAVVILVLAAGIAGLGFVWRGHTRSLETKERALLRRLTSMAHVVEASPVVLFQWGAGEGWPVEWVSANRRQLGLQPRAAHRRESALRAAGAPGRHRHGADGGGPLHRGRTGCVRAGVSGPHEGRAHPVGR